jgi:hypothetical protein
MIHLPDASVSRVLSFLDYSSLIETASCSKQLHALCHELEDESYEQTMRQQSLQTMQRRLETQAYVDGLENVTDVDRQLAFDAGFRMAALPAFDLSFQRGLLLCV